MEVIILLGAPGAGKGTAATRLVSRLNVRHVSSGDLLRQAVKQGTPAGKEAEGAKFKDYFDWKEPALKAPSHRVLAMRRGESEGFLTMRIEVEADEAISLLEPLFVKNGSACGKQVNWVGCQGHAAVAVAACMVPFIDVDVDQGTVPWCGQFP